jgi:ABC-type nitrate/sulfonate/bicarbonate transport system ATPase subunit
MSIGTERVFLSYGNTNVLSDFSIDLPDKGIVGLFGPSGCGKTTFLHLMAGLIRPDSGTVTGPESDRIAIVFQEDRLIPWMTASDNIDLIVKDRSLTDSWIERIGMKDQKGKYPHELSGGMKRRVALARALAFRSGLLLLDEPFNGLDEDLKNLFYNLIREAALDKPVLLICHDWDEIELLSDHIYKATGTPLQARRVR